MSSSWACQFSLRKDPPVTKSVGCPTCRKTGEDSLDSSEEPAGTYKGRDVKRCLDCGTMFYLARNGRLVALSARAEEATTLQSQHELGGDKLLRLLDTEQAPSQPSEDAGVSAVESDQIGQTGDSLTERVARVSRSRTAKPKAVRASRVVAASGADELAVQAAPEIPEVPQAESDPAAGLRNHQFSKELTDLMNEAGWVFPEAPSRSGEYDFDLENLEYPETVKPRWPRLHRFLQLLRFFSFINNDPDPYARRATVPAQDEVAEPGTGEQEAA
jgi:hypothetical protein